MTAIAQASQIALLPPLPPQVTGISIAARYRSATPGAPAGGDLYEIIPTGHGIRVIIGDVRGKGLDTIMLARHVLGNLPDIVPLHLGERQRTSHRRPAR
jgi:phosphoserine phosphatase RsbU/P